jgi:iron complex transport system substrate-binding protein
VLVMQRGERSLSADTVFAQPALAMTPAAERNAFVSMDGLFLLGFGPRTARAAHELAAHLYPNIDAGALTAKDADAARCDQ